MTDYNDRIRVHIENREYSVVGGKFQDMLAAVKQINGRRFVGELKVWQLPGSAETIQNELEISGYRLEGGTPVAQTESQTPAAPARTDSDRIRVVIQGHPLAVVGGTFQEMLAAVKTLPGRRFDGDKKVWEIPGELAIIKHLIEDAGFALEGADKISLGPVPPMESPDFGPDGAEPDPFEMPDFAGPDDIPPYEPPDWWDDDSMPPPPDDPPDWFEDELAARSPEPPPMFNSEPPAFSPAESSPPADAPASVAVSRGQDQIRIRVGGIPLVVRGGAFKEMLEVVKKIPGRRFHSQDKTWDIPGDLGIESVQQTVNAAGFILDRA